MVIVSLVYLSKVVNAKLNEYINPGDPGTFIRFQQKLFAIAGLVYIQRWYYPSEADIMHRSRPSFV